MGIKMSCISLNVAMSTVPCLVHHGIPGTAVALLLFLPI